MNEYVLITSQRGAGSFDMEGLATSGEVIARKYRVDGVIASGGMGVVVAATHIQLGIRVALKFLTAEASQRPEASARFAREARAAAMMRSEHVCRVMDVGTLESGTPFLVMEYLEGSDLGTLLEKTGPFGLEDAVTHVLQAGEALAEAHSLGIVHRDIKPSNLFLTRGTDGQPLVKVLDFGISKFNSEAMLAAQTRITSTHSLMGSPMYMAPEQIRSTRDVDARADIWALGLVLYELLSGVPAFAADSAPAVFARIVLDPPTPLPALNLPPKFVAVVSIQSAKAGRSPRGPAANQRTPRDEDIFQGRQ